MARNAPVIIIPARVGSKRLPSKPLLKINGDPLILHVWRQAQEADIAPVHVATDSETVAKIILDAGFLKPSHALTLTDNMEKSSIFKEINLAFPVMR